MLCGNIAARIQAVNILGLLFFLGGLARLLAWAVAGPPNWFYVVMIPVELVLPIIHWTVARRIPVDDSAERRFAA